MRTRLIAAAGLLGLLFASCDGGGGTSTPTQLASPSATAPSQSPPASPGATAPADTVLGLPVTVLRAAADVPFPANVAAVMESGCWGCDAPAAAIQRVYRDPSGALRTEDLYRLPGATPAAAEIGGRYIMSLAPAEQERGDLLLSLCESPYCGGVASPFDGSRTAVLRSVDGGINWTKEATLDGGAWVVANQGSPGGAILRRVYRPSPGAALVTEVVGYPSLERLPYDLSGATAANTRFLVAAEGSVLIVGDDGVSLYRLEDASRSNDPWPNLRGLPAGSKVVDLQFVGNGIQVSWTSAGGALYTGRATAASSATTFSAIYRWPDGVGPSFLRGGGGLLANGSRLVDVTWPGVQGQLPVVVDFDAGTISPVAEFRGRSTDRNLVRSVLNGTFARVTGAGEGDCLNVREAPSLLSAPLACYPDGVLLVELGERRDAEDQRWAYVKTPAERSGWASQTYLETSGSAPSLNSHPAGTRTGDAKVDAVIAAFESGNDADIAALIGWSQVACVAPPVQGLGGPPECPPGVAAGTMLDVIQGAACEGYYHIRPADGSAPKLVVGPANRLYAVVRPAAGWRNADIQLVYADPQRPEQGRALFLAGGRVIGDWSGCLTSPAAMAAQGSTVVFPPPAR